MALLVLLDWVSWRCTCATASPHVSLRMSFSILHLPPGPLLPVVLIFHYSGCHVDLLVFSQDASSRLPFASVISWPRLVRMVVVVQCSCWGTCCLPAPLPLTWSSASLAFRLAYGDWVGIFIRLQIPLGILRWFLDLPLLVWDSHAGFLLPESFG